MKTEKISQTANEQDYEIDAFIKYLQDQKEKGATHLKFWVTDDPLWRFQWLETFRIKSNEDIRQEKIKKLESDIAKLKKY